MVEFRDHWSLPNKAGGRKCRKRAVTGLTMPRHSLTILCRIAHIENFLRWYGADRAGLVFRQTIQSEQFRPATIRRLGDHDAGDEHFRPLFQVL
jgi:hypothetical protein